jgi:mono/diheme cytochrome c family protein
MKFMQTTGFASVGGWLAISLSLLLASCGGGSDAGPSASASGSTSAAVTKSILTGIAATGGPISGTVSLKDSSAGTAMLNGATASDGSYSFDVTGLTPPFLLRVSYGNAPTPSTLYSLAAGAGNANITPLTSIAARAAIGGADIDSFFRNSIGADVAAAGARMPNSIASLQNALAPLLQRFHVQGNLLTTPFTADHTGVDAMLDAITVDFTGTQIKINAKSSGAMLFSAPPANSGAGSFNIANLDQMATMAPAPGGSLYTLYCAGCHGALADSTKKGITLARLQEAVANNSGGMGTLVQLSATDMQAIVAALTPTTSTPPATPPATAPSTSPDGAALYAASCAVCHGTLTASRKLGATSVRIQNAISAGTGGMGALSSLTATDIQAIAEALTVTTPALAPTQTAPDGAALYASSCAGCHGPLASSAKQGASIARVQAAITNDTGGMGALSTLSVSDVQAIVTVLTPGTPTPTPTTPSTQPDGAALYAANCSGCHGPLADSAKAGATIARIQDAISGNTGGMGGLSGLSATDVQAIAIALASVPLPPPPTGTLSGSTLYGQYCASCHGVLGNSTKGSASASSIQGAIVANTGGMGALSALSPDQITAIASALAAIAPTNGACGSCHAIPPAVGRHATHSRFSCATCHGVGYATTTVNPTTHNNGVINLVNSVGWVAATKTCANSCHGQEQWVGSDLD